MKQLYSNASNCARAAKVALGAGAQRDVHFTITKTEASASETGITPSAYQFTPIEGAPPVPSVVADKVADKVAGEENVGKAAKPARKAKSKETGAKPARKAASKKTVLKPAAKAASARKRSDGTIGHQKVPQVLLNMATRAGGVTVKQVQERMGYVSHTVRGLFSRLHKEFRFDHETVNGCVVYSNPRPIRKQAAERAAEHEGAGLGVEA